MQERKRQPVEIGKVIDQWFENKNISDKRTNYGAFHNWAKIVGSDIAKNTEPVKFFKNTLVIRVSSSVWTQELQYLKPKLLEKIKSSMPETKITDLIFRIGKIGG